jgi:HK97 family phage major capsid protein
MSDLVVPESLLLPVLYREARVEAISTKSRVLKLSFSSETPVEREFGDEVLSHAEGAADLSRFKSGRAPLLLDHDAKKQIGSIRTAWIDSQRKKGFAEVKFSRGDLAEEIWSDIEDDTRANTSVGYKVLEVRPNRSTGEYLVTKWLPVEISVVSIPADPNTYIEKVLPREVYEVRILDSGTPKKVTMENDDDSKTSTRAVADERERVTEIAAIGKQFKLRDLADTAIAEGKSIRDFQAEVLAHPKLHTHPITPAYDVPNIQQSREHRYSLTRMLTLAAQSKPVTGLEGEISAELCRTLGRSAQGYFVPESIFTRDLTASAGTGGQLVPTILDSTLIELLRKKAILGLAGATTMGGLVGHVALPRQTGAGSIQWLSEVAPVVAADQAFDQVVLSAKRASGQTVFSKSLMAQSSLDVETIVRQDLATILALAIDSAGLYGTGATNNQPLGLFGQTGLNTVTFGGPATFANVVLMEAEVEAANALKGNLSYITSPLVKSKFKTTPLVSAFPRYLWMDDQVNGYPAWSTNQITDNKLIFGNFADLIIGSWAGLDVVVDPFSKASTGEIVITIMQLLDVAVRHPASFTVSTDAANQ